MEELRSCPICEAPNTFAKPGSFDICSACGWEDDPVQTNDPDFPVGANNLSMNKYREAGRKNPTPGVWPTTTRKD
jgi:hypothetical protein